MTFGLTLLRDDEVAARLSDQLQSSISRTAVHEALVAEHIRALVWVSTLATTASSSESRPAHTTRITTAARKVAASLGYSRSEADGLVTSIFARLTVLGDIVSIGRGYWLSSPTRFMRSPDESWIFALGGAPREVLTRKAGTPFHSASGLRYVGGGALSPPRRGDDISTTFDDWLGPAEPIESWTDTVLAFHTRTMSRDDISADQLELYAPDILRERARGGRWMAASEVRRALSGCRLFRPRASYATQYDRPYYLGTFEYRGGALVLTQSAKVDYEITRRLRFGLDRKLATIRTLDLVIHPQTCTLILPYALPEPENRVLSFGWSEPSSTGAGASPRSFPRAALSLITHAFERLGMKPKLIHGSA